MNVAIDESNSMFYTGYFENKRKSFEIFRAPLESPVVLESFFRTTQDVRNNDCLWLCCEGASHTYFELQPRDYVIDGGEVFISWDGFYQDCSDEFASKTGLKWAIGVSKVEQSPECVSTLGLEPVKFEDCTTPVSILYEHGTARNILLGYSGFASSNSRSGKRMFYLSVIDNAKTGLDGAGAQPSNEIWAMTEEENYTKNPKALQIFGGVGIQGQFLDHPVDDVGTIRFRYDENRIPDAMCRTAYDAGVFCYSLQMEPDNTINVIKSNMQVTPKQIEESCTLKKSDHYPITKVLPPVSTGLEVFWGNDASGAEPELLFFGCYGEINSHGNFTTAFSTGRTTQTMPGGYPGTILFGKDIAYHEPTSSDYAPGDFAPYVPPKNRSNGWYITSFFVIASLAVGLSAWRRIHTRRQESRAYERVIQSDSLYLQESGTEMAPSKTAYVELSAQFEVV
jgi:hypothetical protein